MPTIAYNAAGVDLDIDGQRFDQIVTLAFDSAARRIRGRAICSGSDFQTYLRKLRAGDIVRVTLRTRERTEISNQDARVLMVRIRVIFRHPLTVNFVFALSD